MASTMALRAATHRLTTTPVEELPSAAAYLASTLCESSSILSAPENQRKVAGAPDAALLVTKLKARITSLLQDKSIEGRWTAIILVKAAIEAGKWEILRGCEPWVRALLAILGLTRQYPTLTREITTPSLPAFITACLNLISSKSASDSRRKLKRNSSLVASVFSSFLELLPNHPTIFRPFSAQIHDLLLPLIGSIGSADFVSEPPVLIAQRLLVALHHCAPKNTAGEEWFKGYRSTILSAHHAGDHLFRGIKEQWESADAELRHSSKSKDYSTPVGDDGQDPLGLQPWNGIQEGSGRLVSLLGLLSQFLSCPSHSSVSIPIGSTLDLTSRLASLHVPASEGEAENSRMINREVSRSERESLFSELPAIYISTLNLLTAIIKSFGTGSVSIAQSCLDQALCIFDNAKESKTVRTAAYRCINTILPVIGCTSTKQGVSLLTPAIRLACADLLPQAQDNTPTEQNPKAKGNQTVINADAFLGTSARSTKVDTSSSGFQDVQAIACQTLVNTLAYLPTELIPLSLRAEIDRTAILTGNAKLMMASILNPIPSTNNQPGHASILPFLARNNKIDLEVEGLLRPRMPVLTTGAGKRKFDFAIQQNESDVEEAFNTANRDTIQRPVLATENTVLADLAPKPMDIDTAGLDSRGTKRSRETDSEPQQATAPVIISSPGKKARADMETPIIDTLQEESLHQRAASVEMPYAGELLSHKSVVPKPGEDISEPLEPTVSQGFFQASTSVLVQKDIVAVNEDEEMSSGDEIPQLNIEPDTDEEDDISMQ
ncbi:predicted protein [Uncinocarpus reesii 1704]|uniref:Pre-rRNA-processing protein RIX1 n=1 Tax=Uncinocarpus reesii (strain UAMH 1704) TaxID=336963 RepID=C4JNF4_UNCRE|nr:uncharacterized protein UREG_04360 [Uncinocarpus reesii 1704]EEP79514.1 predicted protein [Uncinocarpus reesii 1704]